MDRATATKTQKQQLRRRHGSQRPAPTLSEATAWCNTRFATPRRPRRRCPGTVVCRSTRGGPNPRCCEPAQFILPAAENSDLREEENLLATVLAFYWVPGEGKDESGVGGAGGGIILSGKSPTMLTSPVRFGADILSN